MKINILMTNYINDLKQGCWIIFDNAGNKRYEMYYHKGEKVGAAIFGMKMLN